MLNFTIPGKPVAKQSVKFTRSGHKYTPEEMVSYANWAKHCFREAHPEHLPSSILDKALMVVIIVFFEIPKSFSKSKRQKALDGIIRPTVKPDCDNISKNILDALNGIAYPDDKQIVSLSVAKLYGINPYVAVHISEISD